EADDMKKAQEPRRPPRKPRPPDLSAALRAVALEDLLGGGCIVRGAPVAAVAVLCPTAPICKALGQPDGKQRSGGYRICVRHAAPQPRPRRESEPGTKPGPHPTATAMSPPPSRTGRAWRRIASRRCTPWRPTTRLHEPRRRTSPRPMAIPT